MDDATVVNVPSSTLGWLETDDVDVFRIELTEFGTLTVYTESWIDTRGSLDDADGARITSDEDSGVDRNFHISRDLDAGTYYIGVRGAVGISGEYRLHVEFKAPAPDLVIENAELSDIPTVGEEFTLSVEVRNQGNGRAEATTLRFYRSDDRSLTRNDEEMATAEVGELAGGESSEHSIEVPVEKERTFSYGACVDSVDGEESITNNCSSAASEPHLEPSFDLDPQNSSPAGIAHADGLLYVGDWIQDKVYVYTISGQRRPDSDFDLDNENSYPRRLELVGDLVYVVDNSDDKVYVYTTTGERRADSDFNLASSYTGGITHANGLFYVLDWDRSPSKVHVYTTSGQRRASSDFDLERYRSGGITYAEGLLYLSTWSGASSVHAYTTSGTRRADNDFDLDPANSSTFGMDYDGRRFYVLDDDDNRVFIYPSVGNNDSQARVWASRVGSETIDSRATHAMEKKMDLRQRARSLLGREIESKPIDTGR